MGQSPSGGNGKATPSPRTPLTTKWSKPRDGHREAATGGPGWDVSTGAQTTRTRDGAPSPTAAGGAPTGQTPERSREARKRPGWPSTSGRRTRQPRATSSGAQGAVVWRRRSNHTPRTRHNRDQLQGHRAQDRAHAAGRSAGRRGEERPGRTSRQWGGLCVTETSPTPTRKTQEAKREQRQPQPPASAETSLHGASGRLGRRSTRCLIWGS